MLFQSKIHSYTREKLCLKNIDEHPPDANFSPFNTLNVGYQNVKYLKEFSTGTGKPYTDFMLSNKPIAFTLVVSLVNGQPAVGKSLAMALFNQIGDHAASNQE